MTVHLIRGRYWADDIVNELVSMYFMEALRGTEGVDFGVGLKWGPFQDVLVAVSSGGVPLIIAGGGQVCTK